jgi:flavin reductase (DIM6/NTAB) family NADH-FMN oxidoreductase RutF
VTAPGAESGLYVGTPVVLISTTNDDGTANLAPISSAWWTAKTGVIGMGTDRRP